MRYLLLPLLALLLIACAAPAAEPTAAQASPPAAATNTAAPVEAATATPPCTLAETTINEKLTMPEGAVIVLRKEGGIAGLMEVWTIYADGRLVKDESQAGQIAPERVEALVADVVQTGFFDMESSYVPRDTCCDRFTYWLAVRECDQVQAVTTIDDAPNAPAELWEAIRGVEQFVRNNITESGG